MTAQGSAVVNTALGRKARGKGEMLRYMAAKCGTGEPKRMR